MKDGEPPEAKRAKVQQEHPMETVNGIQKPTVDPAQMERIRKIAKHCGEQGLINNAKEVNGDTKDTESSSSHNVNSKLTETDRQTSATTGRQLETIIDRLIPNTTTHPQPSASGEDSDDEALICKADATTQTSLNFMKAIRDFVVERMKSLELSLLTGKINDNQLNVKLEDVQKENRELRDKAQKLQDKLDLLIQANGKDERGHQPSSNLESEAISISSITKQSAVVSPYNVHASMSPTTSNHGVVRNDERTIPQSAVELRSPQVINQMSQNEQNNQTPQEFVPNRSQVKFVTPRSQQHPAAGPSHYVQVQQIQNNNVTIQRAPHPLMGARPPGAGNQVVYVNQPVRVASAPRMSTLPPQMQYIAGQPRQIVPSHTTNPNVSQNAQVLQYVQRPSDQQGGPRGPGQFQEHRMQIIPPNMATGPRIIQIADQRPTQPPPYPSPNRVPLDSIPLPSRLQVNINVTGNGIVLSWDLESTPQSVSIECYHLFASQDSQTPPTALSAWKKIGVVKALPLPMACTLTQFVSGNSYHFAVLAVDIYGRDGPLSNPCTVKLNK